MKESSGELSMTVITIVAIIAIGGIVTTLALPNVRTWITNTFNELTGGAAGGATMCPAGQTYNAATGMCG